MHNYKKRPNNKDYPLELGTIVTFTEKAIQWHLKHVEIYFRPNGTTDKSSENEACNQPPILPSNRAFKQTNFWPKSRKRWHTNQREKHQCYHKSIAWIFIQNTAHLL